jgi:hypothetical protein
MSEVKRYGHIGYLVNATAQLCELYRDMEVYVKASDFDAAKSELAALREELETSYVAHHETAKVADDLQQRLAAAEQRNAVLTKALIDIRENSDDSGAYECASEALGSTGRDTDPKPTESGASE